MKAFILFAVSLLFVAVLVSAEPPPYDYNLGFNASVLTLLRSKGINSYEITPLKCRPDECTGYLRFYNVTNASYRRTVYSIAVPVLGTLRNSTWNVHSLNGIGLPPTVENLGKLYNDALKKRLSIHITRLLRAPRNETVTFTVGGSNATLP